MQKWVPLFCNNPLTDIGTGLGMMAEKTDIPASTEVVQTTAEEVTEMTGLQETAFATVTGHRPGKLKAKHQPRVETKLLMRASLQQQRLQRLHSSGLP